MKTTIGCLYCGVFYSCHQAEKCFDDLAKDILVDNLGKDTRHYWTKLKVVQDWYGIGDLSVNSKRK